MRAAETSGMGSPGRSSARVKPWSEANRRYRILSDDLHRQLPSRMAAMINGQLLSEGEILQNQSLTVSECGGEYRDEGK
jgi:hypothetical protein